MSGNDGDINMTIGQLQGQMQGILSTQQEILSQLKDMNKWNTELYASTKSNGEKIEKVEADLSEIEGTLDTLKASRNKAIGLIGGVSLLSGGIGAFFTDLFGGVS